MQSLFVKSLNGLCMGLLVLFVNVVTNCFFFLVVMCNKGSSQR